MFDALLTALAGTGYAWAHHGWSKAPDATYGVWSEDSGADFVANGRHAERCTIVILDLFTRDDSTTPRTTVETALNALPYPWLLDSVQFEVQTGLIHLQWRVSVYG